jgi:cephalosporin hydroxylase
MDPAAGAGMHGDVLKEAVRQLAAGLREKLETTQGGVGTFADHAILGLLSQLDAFGAEAAWEPGVAELAATAEGLKEGLQRLQGLAVRQAQGRFVDYDARARGTGLHGSSDLSYFELAMSQGTTECLRWRGLPLFKTVYDFALYPMLVHELRPRTVIELGSGTGASALWLADVLVMQGTGAQVHSLDVTPPDVTHERVRFIQGDCRAIEAALPPASLAGLAHPWLVIEDAHVNVHGVLAYLHEHAAGGDYVIVEDSAGKQEELAQFLSARPGCYRVDTRYTDFFGRNATCAQDSILVRSS